MTFATNRATTAGGARYLTGGINATLTGVILSGNQSTAGDGGAIYGNSAALTLGGSVTGNSATGSGGGLYLTGGSASLNNITLNTNTAATIFRVGRQRLHDGPILNHFLQSLACKYDGPHSTARWAMLLSHLHRSVGTRCAIGALWTMRRWRSIGQSSCQGEGHASHSSPPDYAVQRDHHTSRRTGRRGRPNHGGV
jgi:hypothetical protein